MMESMSSTAAVHPDLLGICAKQVGNSYISFISYILLKTRFGNSRSQWQQQNDFLIRGKSVSSNQKAAVKTIFNK